MLSYLQSSILSYLNYIIGIIAKDMFVIKFKAYVYAYNINCPRNG